MSNRSFKPAERFELPNGLVVFAEIHLILPGGEPMYQVAPGGDLVELTGESCALDSDDLTPVPLPPSRSCPFSTEIEDR